MKHGRIVIADPHGFCSGVHRAIETIEAALKVCPLPVYCLHEIVHNSQVVSDLSARGVRFVEDLNKIPDGATLLFSAHGVSPEIKAAAESKGLNIIDATCPFVAKVHSEARRFAEEGRTVFIVGQKHHDEVIGVAGEARGKVEIVENEEQARRVMAPNPDRVGVVCQTTLSASFADAIVDILRSRFPFLKTPDKNDICYATRNRQQAALALAKIADLILVLGSPNSANTRRLAEVAEGAGCRTMRVGSPDELEHIPLRGIGTIGITSGASTPEFFLAQAMDRLRALGFDRVEHLAMAEESSRRFPLPAELRKALSEAGRRREPR